MVDAEVIETIVRRVLKGMLSSDAPSIPSPTIAAETSSILNLSQALITLASLPPNLDGIREVHLAKGTVMTPSVADLLRSKRIAVTRGFSVPSSASPPLPPAASTAPFEPIRVPPLIVSGSANFLPAIKRAVCPRQASVQNQAADDTAALRDAAVGLRSGHRAAVVVAASAHALAWQAARDDKLRPAVVTDWGQLTEILAEVPTNLMILSTKRWNAAAASNVIRAFYKQTMKG